MTSFSTSVELYFKISVRPSGLFLHIESEIPLRVTSPVVVFPKKTFFALFYAILCHFVPYSCIFAQLSGRPGRSDLSNSGCMASL